MIKNATLALKAAKPRGPNGFLAFSAEIGEETRRHTELRSEVKAGLAAGQFVPFYQPKIDLRSGQLTGFEALARWERPDGLRAPAAFLPALEDMELSRSLFLGMLDKILFDIRRWRSAGSPAGASP